MVVGVANHTISFNLELVSHIAAKIPLFFSSETGLRLNHDGINQIEGWVSPLSYSAENVIGMKDISPCYGMKA